MLKRLVLGLLIGLILGGLIAAGVVLGLHWTSFADLNGMAATMAYALAAGTGAVVGLVAGKPIWAKGGQIEAGLKAFFGALLAAAGMFALRTWVHVDLDLAMLHAGSGPIGDLPGATLPLIAAALGGIYELDNTPESADSASKATRIGSNVRVAAAADEEEDEAPAAAKKRTR
jgi:hypothetical protein